MKKLYYFITGWTILMPYFLMSQSHSLEIKGKVINSVESIAFANVILYHTNNKTRTGDITGDDGSFRLIAQQGEYKLTISFLGYQKWEKSINLTDNIDLGTILLQPQDNELKEIVITAEKPLIERKVDRLVFNVGQSVSATGGNAMDALKVTPRVKVQNDEISMIGKGNLMVMINDRLVQLSGEDLANYLKSLNIEDIQRIEVISNPPAKYSAEGNSGLINIVTKKAATDAWNASLRSSYRQATHATGNIGGNLNFQKGKFQVMSNVNYTNGSTAPVESNKVFYPNLTWDEMNNRRDYSNALSARLGVEYKINKKLSTGFDYKYVNSQPLVKDNSVAKIYNARFNVMDSIVKTPARNEYENNIHSLNYHLVYKMDTIGRKLSLDFDFFDYNFQADRKYHTQTFYPNNQPTPKSFVKSRNFGVQDVQNYSVSLDMEHPTSWATLNYGGRISFIKTDNLFNTYDYINNQEVLNTNLSNLFDYKENTQALYFSVQKQFSDKWEGKAGLRIENTQTEGYSATLSQTDLNDYMKLFPTAYLAYTINDDNSLNLNYGKRISRPRYQFLNPFVMVFSPYSYSEGNPFLQPAFIDNIELEYAYKNKWIASFYYSYVDDLYGQVTFLNENTNVQRIFPENYQTNSIIGFYQSLNIKPLKSWKISTSSNISYNSTDSKIPGILQQLNGWNASFDISNDLTLNSDKTLFFNLYFYYRFRGVSNLDYNSSANQLDASLKWLLLDKKLTISLYVNDILSSSRITYTTYSNNIKNSFRNYYDQRYVRLAVSYNFGKKFDTSNRQNKNQDEYNRTN
ncbi:MAG: TonB-dependent receptor domain-containing protein [Mesonia hippocampi]|uniref:TonB-dependent receptor domain-containing protein n=1 Tax=Mesonia hippocampi TaxID=1628250 RepID=UPI003F9C4E9A